MTDTDTYITVELARRKAGDELREQARAAEKRAVKAALAELGITPEEYEIAKRNAGGELAKSGPVMRDGYRFEAVEKSGYAFRPDSKYLTWHEAESHKERP